MNRQLRRALSAAGVITPALFVPAAPAILRAEPAPILRPSAILRPDGEPARAVLPVLMAAPFFSPDANSDPFFANVSALLHFDNNFTDAKGKTWTASNSAATTTAQQKFGIGSFTVGSAGATAYISTLNSTDFQFGTGNFTIEWWARWPSSVTNFNTLYDHGYVGSGALLITTVSDVTRRWAVYISGSLVVSEGSAANAGQWYYYALVRSGSTLTLYRDGSSVGSVSNSSNISGSGSALAIGNNVNGGGTLGQYTLQAHIDDLRITKGVARTVTSIPSAAFPDQ